MKTAEFDYNLPPERIAQTPLEPRHNSRLLVLERSSDHLIHDTFWNLDKYIRPGDLFVINQTRVIPARLHAFKESGGKVEILLLKKIADDTWEALVGGKHVRVGQPLQVENGPKAVVTAQMDGARREVKFLGSLDPYLAVIGEMPLPPYIHERLANPERYQTVYSKTTGSAAAPTAGLHFTPELMEKLEKLGANFARITLHVGLDTFAPVNEDDPAEHVIHTEWCEMDDQTASAINACKQNGGRVIAVGTTSVRTLETAARAAKPGDWVAPVSGATGLFILPGYTFKVVDAMITNFHLPKSTLLMLVSAFAGKEKILDAYRQAVEANYRFFSFGDAMLIS
ncbi:MAG: tRNA preQ1(34) S-adenosylmethionine ribosyltransferase-isomerase QueA [Anaerolineaceae bacterium]|nr:tRNA preQ1(34) S-adenosylmethionine ribosyltransferase-isomerase QueA [Anaerolineaceae bacterium]